MRSVLDVANARDPAVQVVVDLQVRRILAPKGVGCRCFKIYGLLKTMHVREHEILYSTGVVKANADSRAGRTRRRR